MLQERRKRSIRGQEKRRLREEEHSRPRETRAGVVAVLFLKSIKQFLILPVHMPVIIRSYMSKDKPPQICFKASRVVKVEYQRGRTRALKIQIAEGTAQPPARTRFWHPSHRINFSPAWWQEHRLVGFANKCNNNTLNKFDLLTKHYSKTKRTGS